MSSEETELRQLLAAQALRLFPPSIRDSLIADAEFRDRHGIHTDATITLGAIGLAFKRNEFFSAVRAALGGATGVVVTAINETTWRIGTKANDGRRVITLEQDERKIALPGLLILSPGSKDRLSEFDSDAATAGVSDPTIDEWRRKIESAPIADEDFEDIRSELRNSPLRVAAAISDEIERGESSVALIAPRGPRYYERLVGAWTGQGSLSEFVSTSGATHIRKLFAWHPAQGLKLALLMSSHQSVSELIAGQQLPLSVISEVFEQLAQVGDRLSQVGAIEIGLKLLPAYPELEAYLAPLVRQIVADDPGAEGRLTLVSGLIVFVEGEIARSRALAGRPPYWRRLASIAQAALIERELISAGVPPDSSFSAWATQGRGQYFFLQTLVDLQKEPRWLPDFVRPDQLKSEFLGRLADAAQKHEADIRSDELRSLLLGNGEGSIRSLLRFPFPYLPGPLEGGIQARNDMPKEISVAIREQMQAKILQPNSFAALVNSALLFNIGPDYADVAASALRRAKYQFRGGGGSELHFSLLSGLATVAAVTRSNQLANDVRILTRGVRRRLRIGEEDAMRICFIAAAAFTDRSEWSSFVGDWMTELAFEDLDSELAVKLLSHIRALCQIEPALWQSCARAEAALTALAA